MTTRRQLMNIFTQAPVVSGSTKEGKKSKTVEVPTKDIEILAALKTVVKSIEAEIAVVDASIKESICEYMVEKGCETESRPDNYKGIDNTSSASLQMRNRSSASALSDEEREVLDEHQISYDKSVMVPETFIINPAYATDMDILSKISDAISHLNLPADFFLKQEEKVKYIVNENSVADVFTKDEETATILLPIVTTFSITPKLGKDVNAYKVVDEHMNKKNVDVSENN